GVVRRGGRDEGAVGDEAAARLLRQAREVRERQAPAVRDDVLVGEREAPGLDSELSGGEREELALEVGDGGPARVADREGGPAALGSEVERRREGIRRGYDDVREIDAELLREDLGGAGEGGRADLRGARVQRHRPVRVDLHVDAGGAAGGRPPAAGEPLAAAGS